jgi:hypothetical protein
LAPPRAKRITTIIFPKNVLRRKKPQIIACFLSVHQADVDKDGFGAIKDYPLL